MWLLNVIGIAIGLGMDVFSVSMAVGVRWHGPGQKFRLAWHAGLFQFLMPLIGYGLGSQLAGALAHWASYIAAGLVAGIGVKMLVDVLRSGIHEAGRKTDDSATGDPTRGWSLVMLSVATSIDALVVGFSLGIKEGAAIWQASLLIGATAGAMALLGIVLGRRAGQVLGKYAELVGGVVLVALGAVFLWL